MIIVAVESPFGVKGQSPRYGNESKRKWLWVTSRKSYFIAEEHIVLQWKWGRNTANSTSVRNHALGPLPARENDARHCAVVNKPLCSVPVCCYTGSQQASRSTKLMGENAFTKQRRFFFLMKQDLPNIDQKLHKIIEKRRNSFFTPSRYPWSTVIIFTGTLMKNLPFRPHGRGEYAF